MTAKRHHVDYKCYNQDMKARVLHPKLSGQSLREWRKGMGWTQVKLAGELRVSQPTIAQWESDVRHPPFYLGYALNYLRDQHIKTLV
jgi:DNA-binding transcriptional regulator YiaG